MKFLTGIVVLFIIFACAKDQDPELCAKDQNPELHESITGLRSGQVLPQFFANSFTIFDTAGVQTILNKDSLSNTQFAKIANTIENRANPVTGIYFKAAQFRITFNWKNGSKAYSGIYSVKDTVKTLFTILPKGSSIGNAKSIKIILTNRSFEYYDYRFMKVKKKYLYKIYSDNIYSEQTLDCWHHPNSNVFFMDHRI
jgi:hypothetical protein